jgi:hypothetical protein
MWFVVTELLPKQTSAQDETVSDDEVTSSRLPLLAETV